MDFSKALQHLKNGEKIRRKSLERKDGYYYLNSGTISYYDDFNKFIYSTNDIKTFDILADDWEVIIEPPKVGDIVKVNNCWGGSQYGIILKYTLQGKYDVLLDNGLSTTLDYLNCTVTGENHKEIVDDLMNVFAEVKNK